MGLNSQHAPGCTSVLSEVMQQTQAIKPLNKTGHNKHTHAGLSQKWKKVDTVFPESINHITYVTFQARSSSLGIRQIILNQNLANVRINLAMLLHSGLVDEVHKSST